jgi:XTP/dITP diphosphohydrolase
MSDVSGNPAELQLPVAVVLATGNRDKVRELRPLLEGISPSIDLFSLADLGLSPDIEETEPTLEGNARLKAAALFELVSPRFERVIVLADDTGLEVDALDGAPGVRSARFAPVPPGTAPTYDENVSHLLHRLENAKERTARFRTVIALKGRIQAAGGGSLEIDETVEGRIDGAITHERRGDGGFGYDPVFLPEGGTRTFAEMAIEEKNAISHRGRAVLHAVGRIGELLTQISRIPS